MEKSAMKLTISDLNYLEGDEPRQNVYIKLCICRDNTEHIVTMKDTQELLTFDALPSEIVKIQVYTKHRIRRDNFKGVTLGESIGGLCDTKGLVSRKLYKHSEEGSMQELPRSIQFKIRVASAPESPVPVFHEAVGSIVIKDIAPKKMDPDADVVLIAEAPSRIQDARTALNSVESAPWKSLLTKVEKFNDLMAAIAEVHPYSKVAWGVLSAASKFMVDQMNRDENIKGLVSLLDSIFDFLSEASQLEAFAGITANKDNRPSDVRLGTQIRVLVMMMQQVAECSHFICDYAKDKSYWKRVIKHSISEVDDKIQKYQGIFTKLKANFQDHAVLQTQISILQIKFTALSVIDKLDEIAMKIAVNEMPHVTGARYNPDKGCLPNTRVAIIDEIMSWANYPSDTAAGAKIFWLTGVAGSGKSAIAHTVAQLFQSMGRLGSSFCFDASSQAVQGPQHLFSTVSWELGNFDSIWKQELWKVLQANPSIQSSHSILEQFETLVLKPSKSLKATGPIVILIDGLDESGDPASRKVLLSILVSKLVDLPSSFRFIVTSRPEPDIFKALDPCDHVLTKHMEDIGIYSTNNDMYHFIQSSISVENKISLNEHWQGEYWCQLLIDKSEALFQWAATACLFIESDFYTAVEQLEVLLQPTGHAHNLDSLYTQILEQKTSGGDQGKIIRFVTIMRTVLTLKKPLPMSAIGKLCFGKGLAIVKSVLQPLGALLSGVSSDSAPVQALHTSLRDFLTDKTRSGCYFIDTTEEHENLVFACLEVMKELHFNICQLPTSHRRNQEIADLEKRILQKIPPYLWYACRFWVDHLTSMDFQELAGTAISEFMNSKLLYWLEVLSLTKNMDIALVSLKNIASWIEESSTHVQTAALTRDAHSFVATSWVAITESAPHIYLSALPFAPEESLVAKLYCREFRNTLFIQTGKRKQWPGGQNVLTGHQGQINCVSFSPDGKYIVSGSNDKTIWIRDATTGNTVVGPILGHTESVTSVLFTQDGHHIISGSRDKTIQLWDVFTGLPSAKPFEGHVDQVTCLALSPDGHYIVSGSHDMSIRLWNIKTGTSKVFEGKHASVIRSIAFSPDGRYIVSGAEAIKVWDPKTGFELDVAWEKDSNRVRSVAFSPNGLHIVSGSADGTMRVSNIETGKRVTGLIEGHTGSVLSVAFSPDGKYIVSGSVDMTVRVWDAQTGKAIRNPFEGHINWIMSVSFSPDGKYIVSGSKDKTIRMWNLETDGEMVKSPPNNGTEPAGHSHVVKSVAISPNSKNIVSGSYDKSIRVWNSETGYAASGLFEGHTDKVRSVAFSPDGKYIVSGSNDGTARIWDAVTGLPIGKPLGHPDHVTSVAFSPAGKYIVSGSNNKVCVWNAQAGTMEIRPFLGHTKVVTCVTFSPDGNYIASGSDDKTIRLWDAETGSAAGDILQGHTSWVNAVAFSPDGKYITSASADQTLRLWNVETRKQVGTPLKGHQKWVTSVAFSSDGKYIFSGSDDTTIRIWDVHTGKVAGSPLWGHASRVTTVAVSADGKYLISGSADQTIRIWDLHLVLLGLDSPLPFTPGSGPFNKKFRIADGWVVGPDNRLLFWLPLWNRDTAFHPKNPVVITRNPTVLDFSRFVHGAGWGKCRTPV